MLNLIAWILVSVAGVYAVIGVVFALFLVIRGVGRVDPAAAEGTFAFRMVILPGVVAFWPLLMQRALDRSPPPEQRDAHRDLARGSVGDADATNPVPPEEAR